MLYIFSVTIKRIMIVTRYGLDVSGFETRWRRDLPQPSRPTLGALSFLYNGLFSGVKEVFQGMAPKKQLRLLSVQTPSRPYTHPYPSR